MSKVRSAGDWNAAYIKTKDLENVDFLRKRVRIPSLFAPKQLRD